MLPEGSCQQPRRQPPCLSGRTLTGIGSRPGAAAVARLDDESAEPALQLVGPGPVAPFLGVGLRCPGDAFRPDAALEMASDRQVDQPGAVGEFAEAAIPVAGLVRPGQHDLRCRPGQAAVGRARQQGLAAVVVIGEPLLVEHRDDLAGRHDARGDLVHAVLRMAKDVVMRDVADPGHGSLLAPCSAWLESHGAARRG